LVPGVRRERTPQPSECGVRGLSNRLLLRYEVGAVGVVGDVLVGGGFLDLGELLVDDVGGVLEAEGALLLQGLR